MRARSNGAGNLSLKRTCEGFSRFDAYATFFMAMVAGALILTVISGQRPSTLIPCSNRLKMVGIAFRTWASDNRDLYPMQVSSNQGGTREWIGTTNVFVHFLVMSDYLNTPKVLLCPSDTSRKVAAAFATSFGNSNISYFVGVEADTTNGSKLLTGDRNLALRGTAALPALTISKDTPVRWTRSLHDRQGLILFTDGHVEILKNEELPFALRRLISTNQVEFP